MCVGGLLPAGRKNMHFHLKLPREHLDPLHVGCVRGPGYVVEVRQLSSYWLQRKHHLDVILAVCADLQWFRERTVPFLLPLPKVKLLTSLLKRQILSESTCELWLSRALAASSGECPSSFLNP